MTDRNELLSAIRDYVSRRRGTRPSSLEPAEPGLFDSARLITRELEGQKMGILGMIGQVYGEEDGVDADAIFRDLVCGAEETFEKIERDMQSRVVWRRSY